MFTIKCTSANVTKGKPPKMQLQTSTDMLKINLRIKRKWID